MESNKNKEIPKVITKKIKYSLVIGIIWGSISLILIILAFTKQLELEDKIWPIFNTIIVFGLTYGIYKKNRYCATGLLSYYILNFLGLYFMGQTNLYLFFFNVLIVYLLFEGVRGTFKYHKLQNNNHRIDKQN